MNDTIIYNALLINEGEKFKGYVVTDGPVIARVGRGAASADLIAACREAIDARGSYLLPGVIDDQVHFRDPGLVHKGDIATESIAAVAGGVTSFMDMPNTKPPTVTQKALREKLQHASEVSAANYSFFIGATNDNMRELLECDYKITPGVKLFLGSSTGNMLVDEESTLDRIFSEVPAIIAVHSEDEATIRANRQRYESECGGSVPVEMHPLIRSREACVLSTRRAIERAERCNTRLHVLHVSTADEVAMFSDAPLPEKRITAEVCVHHLWFCDEDYARLGSRIKMNPAVKSRADRDALRQGLRDGRIDIVATDHAPHLPAEKEGDALTAASGAPMVQFSLPVMLELADMGVFTHQLVVDKMCHAPARLYDIMGRGFIREGYMADLVLVKPGEAYTVTDDMVLSRCGWTPLAGTTLHNRVTDTWVNGHRACRDGKVDDTVRGTELRYGGKQLEN